jgi:anthranilate phosphoribosyltransferase
MDIKTALSRIVGHLDLSTAEMSDVMREIMTGQCTDAQIGAFMMAMRMKSESIDEIVGAVSVMRELADKVELKTLDGVVDVVGTGGDGANIFNVSTASSFVVAAAGCTVAKHGNRAVSGKSGSADLLEAAGIYLNLTPVQVARCIDSVGIGFMFAQSHHGAMKHAAGPRRDLGLRTLFNMLGPLTNPAGVKHQVVGVFSQALCRPLAEVLQRLGSKHVLVVHSKDGLDEFSLAAPTFVAELKNDQVTEYWVEPEDLGMKSQSLHGLAVESPAAIAGIDSRCPGASQDRERSESGRDDCSECWRGTLRSRSLAYSLTEGVALAHDALHTGLAREKLEELGAFTAVFKMENEG